MTTFASSAPVNPGVARASPPPPRGPALARHPPQVHAQDPRAPVRVRRADEDAPGEPPGSQQRGVQGLRAVRRGEDEDPAGFVEPVHLDEHLVQRLVALLR